mmetsp:Transcript_109814/g.309638  ORF Transcript_109814/g.309638 Transcript_109814/m.309638 type:complete len:224 (-) Transcript_109814:216-887(-)
MEVDVPGRGLLLAGEVESDAVAREAGAGAMFRRCFTQASGQRLTLAMTCALVNVIAFWMLLPRHTPRFGLALLAEALRDGERLRQLLRSCTVVAEEVHPVHVAEAVVPVEASEALPSEEPSLYMRRVEQLGERTRICTRAAWEDAFLPALLGEEAAEAMRSSCHICSICMSSLSRSAQVRGLACGHLFHIACLAEWFMRDRSLYLCCPLCRLPLSQQARIPDI